MGAQESAPLQTPGGIVPAFVLLSLKNIFDFLHIQLVRIAWNIYLPLVNKLPVSDVQHGSCITARI